MRDWRDVDLEFIKMLCQILKPFKEATVIMSTESSASISLVRPLLHQLMAHCQAQSASMHSQPALHELCETIKNDLESR